MAEQREKEPEYAVVCENEAEGSDRIELPTNASDNSLGLQTLTRAFPNAHGLKYKNPATGAYRALLVDSSGTVFYKPAGGWENKLFVIISNQPQQPVLVAAPPRSETPKAESNDDDVVFASTQPITTTTDKSITTDTTTKSTSSLCRINTNQSLFTDDEIALLKMLCEKHRPRQLEPSMPDSRPDSPLAWERLPGETEDAYIVKFQRYLRYIEIDDANGRLSKGCVTVLNANYAVTNLHIVNRKLYDEYRTMMNNHNKQGSGVVVDASSAKRPKLDSPLKSSKPYDQRLQDIRNWTDKKKQTFVDVRYFVYDLSGDGCTAADIKEVNFKHDFAILFSADGGLLLESEKPLSLADDVSVGDNYVAIGLPNQNGKQHLSVFKGHISRKLKNSDYFGAYGAEKGYSGGPVFRLGYDNDLIGIIAGGLRADKIDPTSAEIKEAFGHLGHQAALARIVPTKRFSNIGDISLISEKSADNY